MLLIMLWNDRYQTTAAGGGPELFVLGCSDGSFKLVSKAGRVEKSVAAHTCVARRRNFRLSLPFLFVVEVL
jgi:hypothetical protein